MIHRPIELQDTPAYLPDMRVNHVVVEGAENRDPEELARMLYLGRSAVVAASASELVAANPHVVVAKHETMNSQRSAHEVGFGFMAPNAKAALSTTTQAVALKPFTRAENALTEMNGYRVLAELGIETFEPVGVFPAAKGQETFVGVTKRRNDLVSLDQAEWVVGRRITDEASIEIAERNSQTVQGISQMLAYAHANGVYHEDGQIKNYATTPEGKLGMIDAEGIVQAPLNHPRATDYAIHNLEKFATSLIVRTGKEETGVSIYGIGMLQGLGAQDMKASVEELVISPYLDALSEQLDTASDEKAAHIQSLFDSVDGQFQANATWPLHT